MAKPKTKSVIEGDKHNHTMIRVWTPAPTSMKELIEAIEGVTSAFYSKVRGYLVVWLNPCYDRNELIAEIKEVTDGTDY